MKYKDLSLTLSKSQQIENDVPKKLVYLYLEAELSLVEVNKLLDRIRHQDLANEEISESQWDEIKALLAARWERIKDTNASYCANPDTAVNHAYVQLAKAVSKHTAEILDQPFTPWLQVLIPSLSREDAQRYNASDLYGLVMSDDNQHFISVRDAFTLAGLKPGFSESEAERITNYSNGSKYYTSLVNQQTKTSELVSARLALGNTLASREAYVNAYGVAGIARLLANITPHVDRIFTTQDQLLQVMIEKQNDRSHWNHLVDAMSPSHLQNLLLNHHDSLDSCVEDVSFSSDETKNAAISFLFLTLYLKNRAQGDSMIGSLFKAVPRALGLDYTADDKIQPVKKVVDLIINKTTLAHCAGVINETFSSKEKGALNNGLVKKLMDKLIIAPVMLVATPESPTLHV